MKETEAIDEFHKRAAEWFRDHIATESPSNGTLLRIDWRRPCSSAYAIQYIITSGSVIVIGDVGDAIYRFGCTLDFKFLKQCDWHYFTNKCVSSETGRKYTMKVDGIKRPIVNIRAIGHFVGLQMAIKQLELPGFQRLLSHERSLSAR